MQNTDEVVFHFFLEMHFRIEVPRTHSCGAHVHVAYVVQKKTNFIINEFYCMVIKYRLFILQFTSFQLPLFSVCTFVGDETISMLILEKDQ